MKSVVAAASDHPFVVEVTVGIQFAAQLLSDVIGMLDRSRLSRGEHWSLSAEYDKDIRLRFALSSRAFADLLRSAIDIFAQPIQPATKTRAPLALEAQGKATGAFSRYMRAQVAPKREPAPQPQPVIEMPREFQNIREGAFQWG